MTHLDPPAGAATPSSRSPVYAHPLLYQGVMRLLYGRAFQARYQAISELVSDGADVFEACAGDAYLFERYLRPRGVRYRAGEFNPEFVAHARSRGIQMDPFDLRTDEVPRADVVILHASLYQFIPEHRQVVARLLAAARHKLIISEPVRNLSSSRWAVLRWLGTRGTDPGSGLTPQRFDEASLDAFFQAHFRDRVLYDRLIPGGREKIYCLRGE